MTQVVSYLQMRHDAVPEAKWELTDDDEIRDTETEYTLAQKVRTEIGMFIVEMHTHWPLVAEYIKALEAVAKAAKEARSPDDAYYFFDRNKPMYDTLTALGQVEEKMEEPV